MAILKMAATAIKSLFSRPATLMYPARPAKRTPATRGHIVIDPANCITCRSCQRKCPTGAICVEVKEKTWQIDRMRCVICNSCGDVCPTKCLSDGSCLPGSTDCTWRGLQSYRCRAKKERTGHHLRQIVQSRIRFKIFFIKR